MINRILILITYFYEIKLYIWHFKRNFFFKIALNLSTCDSIIYAQNIPNCALFLAIIPLKWRSESFWRSIIIIDLWPQRRGAEMAGSRWNLLWGGRFPGFLSGVNLRKFGLDRLQSPWPDRSWGSYTKRDRRPSNQFRGSRAAPPDPPGALLQGRGLGRRGSIFGARRLWVDLVSAMKSSRLRSCPWCRRWDHHK